jgi:uncharacterized membrane protein YkoI
MQLRKKLALAIGGAVLVGSAAGAVALAGGSGEDSASETHEEAAYTAANRGDASVSRSQAEQTAVGAHAGRAFDTHLQDEGLGLVWEVKVDDGTNVYEVQIDADSGKIVSDQFEGSDSDNGENENE